MVIVTVRTTVGREKTALDSANTKIKNNPGVIKAILSPGELKGYIFVEGEEMGAIEAFLSNVPHIRGIIRKPVPMSTLEQFFEEKTEEITLAEGDLVEVIGGPFKREQARIKRVNEQKREAKIELVEAAVPIPITIKLDLLKKIEKEE